MGVIKAESEINIAEMSNVSSFLEEKKKIVRLRHYDSKSDVSPLIFVPFRSQKAMWFPSSLSVNTQYALLLMISV